MRTGERIEDARREPAALRAWRRGVQVPSVRPIGFVRRGAASTISAEWIEKSSDRAHIQIWSLGAWKSSGVPMNGGGDGTHPSPALSVCGVRKILMTRPSGRLLVHSTGSRTHVT